MKRTHHFWTTRELARLRLEYPVSTHRRLAISFAPHTPISIASTAQALGLHKAARANIKWKQVTDAHIYQTGYFERVVDEAASRAEVSRGEEQAHHRGPPA